MKNDKLKNTVIGILRGFAPEDAAFAAETAISCNMTVLEVAIREGHEEADLATIEALSKRFCAEVFIGAGTVTSEKLCSAAAEAGAGFIVSPVFGMKVSMRCKQLDLPYVPGAMTPTEIFNCHENGAAMVKLFPAMTLGSAYCKAIHAPFPNIPLVAMGGITTDNLSEFRSAGVSSFGISSGIFKTDEIVQRNRAALETRIKGFMSLM